MHIKPISTNITGGEGRISVISLPPRTPAPAPPGRRGSAGAYLVTYCVFPAPGDAGVRRARRVRATGMARNSAARV